MRAHRNPCTPVSRLEKSRESGFLEVERGLSLWRNTCPGPSHFSFMGQGVRERSRSKGRPWTGRVAQGLGLTHAAKGEEQSSDRLLLAHLPEPFREMVCIFTSLFSVSLWTSLRIRLQLVSGFPSVRRYNPSTL